MEGNASKTSNDEIKTSREQEEIEYEASRLQFELLSRKRQQRLTEESLLWEKNAEVLLAPASPSPRKKKSINYFNNNNKDYSPNSKASSSRLPAEFDRELAKREAETFKAPSHRPVIKKPKIEEDNEAHLHAVKRKSNFLSGLRSVTEDRTRKVKEEQTNASKRTSDFNSKALPPTRASSSTSSSTRSRTSKLDTSRSLEPAMSSHKSKPIINTRTAPVSSSEYALSHTSSSSKGKNRERLEDLNEFELEALGEDGLDIIDAPVGPKKRNKDGTLIVRLEMGPIEHKALSNDPNWEKVEPNSGIRLRHKSRLISHSTLQDHLTDRYHLTPDLVYSLLKPGPTLDSQDIDVVGDYVIIGVLAWKDEVRFMNGGALKEEVKVEKVVKKWESVKGAKGQDEIEEEVKEEEEDEMFRKESKKVKQKRYLRFTLVDLSTESASASGSGVLNIMLFEADSETMIQDGEGNSIPSYKGGSGGAYEKFWKETAGAVVAILNPSILKNRPVAGRPNIVTITPNSAESMMVIGRAKDLGSCEVMNYGATKPCGSWVDTRRDHRCDYHISKEVKRTGARRAETNSTNSSLSSTATFNSKKFASTFKPGSVSNAKGKEVGYNRDTKTGLLPHSNIQISEGTTVYVNAGASTSTSSRRNASMNSNSISTTVGLGANAMRAAALQSGNGSGGYISGVRDGPTVKEAKRAQKDKMLDKLLRKTQTEELKKFDGGKSLGGQYIELADKMRREAADGGSGKGKVEKKHKEKGKGKNRKRRRSDDEESSSEEETRVKRKTPFGTVAVRLMGMDPSLSADSERVEDEETKRSRLAAFSELNDPTNRVTAKLGKPPGVKVRSGVAIPKELLELDREKERIRQNKQKRIAKESHGGESDDDDDLVVEGGPSQKS